MLVLFMFSPRISASSGSASIYSRMVARATGYLEKNTGDRCDELALFDIAKMVYAVYKNDLNGDSSYSFGTLHLEVFKAQVGIFITRIRDLLVEMGKEFSQGLVKHRQGLDKISKNKLAIAFSRLMEAAERDKSIDPEIQVYSSCKDHPQVIKSLNIGLTNVLKALYAAYKNEAEASGLSEPLQAFFECIRCAFAEVMYQDGENGWESIAVPLRNYILKKQATMRSAYGAIDKGILIVLDKYFLDPNSEIVKLFNKIHARKIETWMEGVKEQVFDSAFIFIPDMEMESYFYDAIHIFFTKIFNCICETRCGLEKRQSLIEWEELSARLALKLREYINERIRENNVDSDSLAVEESLREMSEEVIVSINNLIGLVRTKERASPSLLQSTSR